MGEIWHVYIDEDGKKCLGGYRGHDKLPFADNFGAMKLFESRKGAERYANSLAREIKKFLAFDGALDGTPEIVKMEAVDGGQFDRRVNVYSSNPDRPPVASVWIKAVLRIVCK